MNIIYSNQLIEDCGTKKILGNPSFSLKNIPIKWMKEEHSQNQGRFKTCFYFGWFLNKKKLLHWLKNTAYCDKIQKTRWILYVNHNHISYLHPPKLLESYFTNSWSWQTWLNSFIKPTLSQCSHILDQIKQSNSWTNEPFPSLLTWNQVCKTGVYWCGLGLWFQRRAQEGRK